MRVSGLPRWVGIGHDDVARWFQVQSHDKRGTAARATVARGHAWCMWEDILWTDRGMADLNVRATGRRPLDGVISELAELLGGPGCLAAAGAGVRALVAGLLSRDVYATQLQDVLAIAAQSRGTEVSRVSDAV